jgi:hypothetical protein
VQKSCARLIAAPPAAQLGVVERPLHDRRYPGLRLGDVDLVVFPEAWMLQRFLDGCTMCRVRTPVFSISRRASGSWGWSAWRELAGSSGSSIAITCIHDHPSDTLAALALEQRWVIAADRRSFLHLAQRAAVEQPEAAAFFTVLAEGAEVRACATIAGALRAHYNFTNEPAPGTTQQPLRRTATAMCNTRNVDPIGQLRQLNGQRSHRVLIQPLLPGLNKVQPPPTNRAEQLAHIGRSHLQGPAVIDDQRQSHFAVHTPDRNRAALTHRAKP